MDPVTDLAQESKQVMAVTILIKYVKEIMLRPYLLLPVLVEVVGGPFLFLAPFFHVLCVALATASLCGNTIPDAGVATTMLVSMVVIDAFFNLFFGGPLQ